MNLTITLQVDGSTLSSQVVCTARPVEDVQARMLELATWAAAVPPQAPAPVAATPLPAPPANPAPAAKNPPPAATIMPGRTYGVWITDIGRHRGAVVRVLQEVLGCSSGMAADILVDPTPIMVASRMAAYKAGTLETVLRVAGATVHVAYSE